MNKKDELFTEEKRVLSDFEMAANDLMPPYNHYAGRDTSVYALKDFAPSLCQQEFADDADINNIMARYVKTGTVPVYMDRQPFYVDATDYPSYQDMQNILINAREAFEALPSKVREQFGNDPARFVDFASDEKNADQLKEWGMLSPEAVQRLDAAKAADAAKVAEKATGGSPKPVQGDNSAPPAADTPS